MSNILTTAKNAAKSAFIFLSNAARRRAVAALVLGVTVQFGIVPSLDLTQIENAMTMITLMGAAAGWSSHTPKVDGDDTQDDEDQAGA